ncbi:hypothetical protein R3W88_007840 [Solanum pinnatisectum]|uniref:Reverse transcriptase zinc-binding domain-containing protein n=1 Tax=Solanum pinnatisectum TaxID=50273 RepID=A0AAV9M9I9_9SOLN|nr:hypothetical protein R3W88_007840 [Solanum pinnatisectum]
MTKWGVTTNLTCPLCQEEDENIEHLFFTCKFTAGVWNKLLAWKGIQHIGMKWHEEVQWEIKYMKGSNKIAQVYMLCLAGTIYHMWIECNCRIFQAKQRSEEYMIRHIIR